MIVLYIHTHIHTYTHTNIHTYTYGRTHTYILSTHTHNDIHNIIYHAIYMYMHLDVELLVQLTRRNHPATLHPYLEQHQRHDEIHYEGYDTTYYLHSVTLYAETWA